MGRWLAEYRGLSPVDIDHRARQVHFYGKNGYAVTVETGRLDGRIMKTLDCATSSRPRIEPGDLAEAGEPFVPSLAS